MQTQTSNTLHNAIIEAGGKDRPPMLAPGNYVQWKSKIKGYIDTKPNHELIHYYLKNPPYKFTWADKQVLISEGIDNDIYSIVDACPNACEMWKAIERNRGKAIVNSPQPIYDLEPSMVAKDDEMSKDKEIDKLMALIFLSFKKIYNPTSNNLRTSSNTSRANQDNSSRINRSTGNGMLETKTGEGCSLSQGKDAIELEAHYMYMSQLQDVSPDAADSGPIFDSEPVQKVLIEQLKDEIEDFKNQNKSLESSNNHFKEANNKPSETNKLLYNDFKKSQAELQRRNDVEYASKVEINCAKAKGDLISYKMESQKSFNKYTQTINDLNQTIFEMKKKLSAHQETISIPSQQKKAQIKLYNTREDKELDKVIALENKVKVLEYIVYKNGQSVQMMNMLNNKCRTSFAKPEFLKKAQRANPRLYDIGCYNDNLALMLAPESDEVIHLEKEIRSNLSDLIRPFDYDKLNNLYDLFVLQREKSSEQRYFSERSRLSHTHKLIEKLKGKSVDTKFRKSSVIQQPNVFKSQRPSILGKPTIFSDSLERKDFSKSKSVTQNNVSNDFSKPVTAQTLPLIKKSILKNTNVLAPKMYTLHTEPTQTRTSQLPQDSRKTNKRVSFSTGVILTTSVSRPQLKSNPIEDRVMLNNTKGQKQEVEDQCRNVKLSKNKMSITACNDSLNAKTLNVNFVCATCGKCVLNEKHDMCVLKSVNGVNSRTKMPIAVPVSTREPKRAVKQSVAKPLKKTVASESNQKPRNITRKLYERVSKACSWWYPKFTPSGYK
nr:hypothetical protein [Tanacetum cinerariifolium]